MATGTVKLFNAKTGHGFIAPSDGTDIAFAHKNAINDAGLDTLKPGQKVSYDLVPGMDGKPAAENIEIIEIIDQARITET
ncbi:MAG: cold-shock protein [Rhodospirillales bacterium]|nr:cold-shock protein [Rhodospirillales bacterium]